MMSTIIYNKKQFIEELTLALNRREDSHIEVAKTGARICIYGLDTVERAKAEAKAALEGKLWFQGRTKRQKEAEMKAELREFDIRLNNPQRIINRFKKTPVAMWG